MARQGYTLVSGGARGTDREGQEACLAAGGRVIAVLAAPQGAPPVPNLLLCWEDSFDLPFSPARALSRNRIIHILGEKTLVAQTSPGFGGTWNGTEENLRRGWSTGPHRAGGHSGGNVPIEAFIRAFSCTNDIFLEIHGLRRAFSASRVKKSK